MIQNPLIIGGNEIARNWSAGSSPFYPGYTFQTASAGPLDLAAAIGSARKARPANLEARSAALRRAARAFHCDQEVLEHTVRVTGMPVARVRDLVEDIPRWLQEVPAMLERRFKRFAGLEPQDAEIYNDLLLELLLPPDGFCYAVTPGNDPRSAALAAANLSYLGIPFILRASRKDAVAPLVLRALLAAGFDPHFASLVYFEAQRDPQSHFRLVDAAASLWTFGPPSLVDGPLRYETVGRRLVVDLPDDLPEESVPPPPGSFERWIAAGGRVETARRDHFEGKTVLRHSSGSCAAVVRGPLETPLLAATGYPLGCMATRITLALEAQEWAAEAAGFLAGLVVGDPLDERTQVGYIEPAVLDRLQELRRQNADRLRYYGGERLSPHQARPLLAATLPGEDPAGAAFFETEIPAYVLAVHTCASMAAAVETLNRLAGGVPRLAVSLHNIPRTEWLPQAARVHAYTLLIDRPTTQVIPIFHEGNDYAVHLRQARLLVL